MFFGGLGPVMVTDAAGREVDLGSPLQRQLLALLLLRRRSVVLTEQIIDHVWQGSPPRAAVTSVQTYVSNLRRILDPDRAQRSAGGVIVSGNGGYLLSCEEDETDVGRFAALASAGVQAVDAGRPADALGPLAEAVALWRGEPFVDLGDLDAAVFERSRLTELRRVADEYTAAALLALGRDVEAAVELERLTREEPLRERRWEMYITALYRGGRQGEALRAFARAREALVEQLGIEPSAELRALERRVIDQDPSLLLAPARTVHPGPPAHAPDPEPDPLGSPSGEATGPTIVGREAPLSRLRAAGLVADGGAFRVSLVSGDAGIGKSALAEAFTAELERDERRVWWAHCLDTPGAPALWPWMQIARQVVAEIPAAAASLVDLLPDLATSEPAATPTDLAAVRFRIFDALTRHIAGSARHSRLTVVLEDIHWADAPTLDMLGFLVESRLRARLHVVVTLRADETSTPALRDLLGRLARSSAVDRIRLGGLDRADIVEFGRLVTGRELTDREADVLHARTAGNPFFLAELSRLLAERDITDVRSSHAIPEGVRDVVLRRLGSIDDELAELLRVAAVAGERFHPAVVTAAAGLDPAASSRLFELGERTHWLARSNPGLSEIRFTHALARDVVLDEQTTSQRERAHWTIGIAMLDVHGEGAGEHLSEIARHLAAGVGAGSADRAIEVASRAAEAATRRQAHDDAVANWSLVESLLVSARPAERERSMRVRLALGESLRLAGDWAEARQAFFRALTDAESLAQPSLIAEAAVSFRTMWLWTWREHGVTDQRMVTALRSCLPGIREDRRMEALVLGYLGVELFYVDREEGLRLGEEAVRIAEGMGDDVLLLETLRGLHLTLKSPEHIERRIEVANRIVEIAGRLGNPEHEAHARVDRSFLLLLTCHPDAYAEHTIARRMTEDLHEPMMIAHVRQHAAAWAYLRGDIPEAQRLAELAHQTHGRSGFWNTAAVHQLAQVLYQHEYGRLREHLAVQPAVSENGSSPITQPIIDIAWAFAAHLVGDDAEALRLLTPPPVLRRGSSWLMMKYLHALTGAAVGAPGLAELYEELVPFAGRVAVGSEGPSTMGVIDHAIGALALALGDRESARHWFTRAVELNSRLGEGPPTRASRAALAALDESD